MNTTIFSYYYYFVVPLTFPFFSNNIQLHLHKLGIMYIDWKPDNIGIDENGNLKLFDFDLSGLINLDTKEWQEEPQRFYSYSKAIQAGNILPEEIDNYAFDLGFNTVDIDLV